MLTFWHQIFIFATCPLCLAHRRLDWDKVIRVIRILDVYFILFFEEMCAPEQQPDSDELCVGGSISVHEKAHFHFFSSHCVTEKAEMWHENSEFCMSTRLSRWTYVPSMAALLCATLVPLAVWSVQSCCWTTEPKWTRLSRRWRPHRSMKPAFKVNALTVAPDRKLEIPAFPVQIWWMFDGLKQVKCRIWDQTT